LPSCHESSAITDDDFGAWIDRAEFLIAGLSGTGECSKTSPSLCAKTDMPEGVEM